MKLGFLTACFPELPLDEIVKWAGAAGFAALEIHCEADDDGPLYAHRGLNVAKLDQPGAKALRALAADHGIEISCLTRCVNLLDADPARRRAHLDLTRRVLDAAALLNVGVVSAFVGRDLTRTIEDNLAPFEEVFGPLCSDAAAKGVRIAIENCPMVGGPAGDQVQNIAMAPPIWRRMFERIPDLCLNFDPSHLYWLGVDYVAAVKEFGANIAHVHLKDTEILDDRVSDGGILAARPRWWRYRVPGLGRIDWPGFLSALVEVGYDGALSFEHEDPVFASDVEAKKRGLLLGRKRIEALLP